MSLERFSPTPNSRTSDVNFASIVHGTDRSATVDVAAADSPASGGNIKHTSGSKAQSDLKACSDSVSAQLYRSFIETAASNMYDLQKLGSVPKLMSKHACDLGTDADAIAAVNKELQNATGDSHNLVYDPKQFTSFDQQITRKPFSGIGAALWTIPNKAAGLAPGKEQSADAKNSAISATTVVSHVFPGTPADRANLKRGDFVVGVNGIDTSKMDAIGTRQLICADKADKVTLNVIHEGNRIEKSMNCESIQVSTVDEPIDKGNGIFYLHIRMFDEKTADDLKAAMEKLRNAKAFVVDLREDGGGLKDQALSVSQLFVEKGTLLRTRERQDSDYTSPRFTDHQWVATADSLQDRFVTEPSTHVHVNASKRYPYLLDHRPLVVLQNGGTASAAEMTLAALHDTAHARTVGEPSRGKGTMQVVPPDPDSAIIQDSQIIQGDKAYATLQVTAGHWMTPRRYWPGDAGEHAHPIKPDVPVAASADVTFDSPEDVQLNRALALAKEQLASNHQRRK